MSSAPARMRPKDAPRIQDGTPAIAGVLFFCFPLSKWMFVMENTMLGRFPKFRILLVGLLAAGLVACGSDGSDGSDGAAGSAGADGSNGLSCWDTNQNGVADLPDEDINGDGVVDVNDCVVLVPPLSDPETLHKVYFTDNTYEGTTSCLDCHGKVGDDFITTGHFTWSGVASNVEGYEAEIHGKVDFINNFCIAVPTNEGRCSQCHAGYGLADATYDFSNPKNVDCLVCHDQSGTYKKGLTTAGLPDPTVDLQVVAQSVADNSGSPVRQNCLACHAAAGGGDNVKHGDLSTDLVATTRDYDVHMGTDGANLDCVACHGVKRGPDGEMLSHGIGGMPFHSVEEGAMKQCADCHGDRASIHAGTAAQDLVANHQRLACQVCHVPAIARKLPTKMEWYWEDAGQDIDPIPVDPITGKPTYDKKKGTFVWGLNVRPELRFHNGMTQKNMMNVNDQYVSTPVVRSAPVADYTDLDAMIYPFKKMIGNQVADANNNTMLVPHLFGMKGGPNPYWAKYDWDLALQDGAAYTGQTYSGAYEFVPTEMYLQVNHEVAPKEMALGFGGGSGCSDCHDAGQVDWNALGWTDNPFNGGVQP